jgi:hypothetical protein
MPENFANRYQTTLAAGVTSGALTGTVSTATGIPSVPFRALISAEGANADEIVLVTNAAGTTLTWTRAAEAVAGVQAASAHSTGALLTAVVTAVGVLNAFSVLPPSNGSDDTAMIQAALDLARLRYTSGLVKGLPGQTYLITTIRVGSYTTLDMTGCTVRQIDGTDTNMLQNWALQAARTVQDANITAGGTTLTSATANFQSYEDEGVVRIWGADQGGEVLANAISSVTNSTTVQVYIPAERTVTNGPLTITQWDVDIEIIGGRWDRGNNGRKYTPVVDGIEATGFAMRIRRVDRIAVRDVTFTGGNSNACSALCFGDATHFLADNIDADTYVSGLIQATGPARYGRFSNIYGRVTDDLVALLAVDWPNVRDVYGDIAHISIDDVHSERCDGTLVVICPGSASLNVSTQHVYVRNVYGRSTNTTQHQGGLVWIGDTDAFPELIGGFIDDIVVENVSGEPMGNYDSSRGLVWLNSPNMGRIRLSGLNIHTPTGGSPGVRHDVVLGSATDIGYLTVTDSVVSSIDGGCDLINYTLAPATPIHNLDIARCAKRVNGVWTILTSGANLTYAEQILATSGLVLYWRLGEPSGTNANDASPANLDGTYTSGTLGATGLITGTDTAWTGNGSTSQIAGPTIPAQAAWTIMWWEKSNGTNPDYAGIFTTPGDRIDIVRITSGGTQPGQIYYYDGGGWIGGAGGWTVDVTATMLALTFDGTDSRTYKNGALVDLLPGKGRSLLNAAFTVGNLSGTRTIDTLDEFAIFSRALDTSEIAGLYVKGT